MPGQLQNAGGDLWHLFLPHVHLWLHWQAVDSWEPFGDIFSVLFPEAWVKAMGRGLRGRQLRVAETPREAGEAGGRGCFDSCWYRKWTESGWQGVGGDSSMGSGGWGAIAACKGTPPGWRSQVRPWNAWRAPLRRKRTCKQARGCWTGAMYKSCL